MSKAKKNFLALHLKAVFYFMLLESEKKENKCNEDELGYIIDKYGNSILRLAFSYLHNKEDAEDILQDTLIQYIRTSPIINNEEHLKAWFLRVAINLSKNKIKSNNIRRADSIEDLDIADAEKNELSFIWEAVKSLPQKYRDVIHLYYYEGYDIKEISDILEIKEGTIKSLLSRGKKLLKSELKEAYDFEI